MVRRLLFAALSGSLLVGTAAAGSSGAAPGEFSNENKALIAATVAFFDEVEAQSSPKRGVPVIGIPQSATRSKAETEDKNPLTRMGPVDHLTGYRITWYPLDRLLGTVDFMGTWDDNRNLVCGYLTWDMSDTDAPKMETLSVRFVDLGSLDQASDIQVHRNLMEANCASGTIDGNYRVFDVAG